MCQPVRAIGQTPHGRACLIVPGASLSKEWGTSGYLLVSLTNDTYLTSRQQCVRLCSHAH